MKTFLEFLNVPKTNKVPSHLEVPKSNTGPRHPITTLDAPENKKPIKFEPGRDYGHLMVGTGKFLPNTSPVTIPAR